MNKKIFGGIAIVAIAVAMAFNVTLSNQKQDKASMLALANVEALADPEDVDGGILPEVTVLSTPHGENSGWLWWTQGATMDEREWVRPCPTSSSTSASGGGSYNGTGGNGSYSESQTNPPTRNEITCPFGWINCTAIDC